MVKYVVGFMFNPTRTKVALIRKLRPDWQKGLLNGIGGKLNEDEHELQAMCREFEEETGYKTFWYDWWPVVTLKGLGDKWEVSVFKCLKDSLDLLKTTTDEGIEIIDVINIDNEAVLSNLPWLIRMCLDDNIRNGEIKLIR